MKPRHAPQQGATLIEFALVLLVFLMFLFGILDFARMLFTWNAAAEAAREGARYAVVCMTPASDVATVRQRMQGLVPQISTVQVDWEPSSPSACTVDTCERVRVRITGLTYQWIAPIPGLTAMAARAMPDFTAVLPREAMAQDDKSAHASICNLTS